MKKNLILFLIFSFFALSARAEKLNLTSVLEVTAFNICKKLTNTSSISYFVPTGSASDWQSFYNFSPPGVSTAECLNYSWVWTGWGACTGGSGSWWESGFGACTGGSTAWSGWSTCSAACTQSRTCSWNTNSGTATQTISCNLTANSGSQTRSVVCQSDTGVNVPDALCSAPKPPVIQQCTPIDTALCGPAPSESMACTPGGAASCAGDATQACTGGDCVPAEPCEGYNACNVAAVCTSYYDDSLGADVGCIPQSGKYCLNGKAVYDAAYTDGCQQWDVLQGVLCN